MKNYDFIPHAANTRSCSQVINLIESEGAAGYGFYWALLEYLRTQPRYTGDIRAIKNIARQMKVRIDKALRILNDYGLFIVENIDFHSPFLDEKMSPMKRKCDKNVSENDEILSEVPCNSLETSGGSFKNKKKNKNKKEEYSSSAEEEKKAAEAAASLSKIAAWEEYVDELQHESQWKEIMAMQSGLKKQFLPLFPRIVECFKQHVRSIGKESHIQSLNDAKHYFCFFLKPGSHTYQRLLLQLKQQEEDNAYRFEQRNPDTGERSYCGIPIPHDAPPRPNDQAVWSEETENWVY